MIYLIGNSHHELINKYWQFNISNSYLDPLNNIDIKSKEQFNKLASIEYKPIIFKPNIYIPKTLESFINDTDIVLAKNLFKKRAI